LAATMASSVVLASRSAILGYHQSALVCTPRCFRKCRAKMKKLLLVGTAVLLMATSASAHLLDRVGTAAHSAAVSLVLRWAATKAELPDAMLGGWCQPWGALPILPGTAPSSSVGFAEDDAEHLLRFDHAADCAHHGGMQVRKDGWDYYRFDDLKGSCELTSIEFRRHGRPEDRPRAYDEEKDEYLELERTAPPSDVYLVRATCKDDDESWYESYEAQTSGDWLTRWERPEG